MTRAAATRSFGSLARARVERAALRGLACMALALALSSGASAQPPPDTSNTILPDDSPPARALQRGGISLQQATAMAVGRYQGRVVRAEASSRGDTIVYEIRILGEDGRVRTVRIDAQTGQFL